MLDMGLGKTASTLAALEPRHLPALVVAPKRVAEEVWDVERDKWRPDLSIAVAMGEPADRRRALNSKTDIAVISRDNLRDVRDTHIKPRTIIIDELSGFKDGGARGSVRWKTARKIVTEHNIQNRWGLTGTPAPNGYLDLWGQIGLLDGGKRLGKNLTGYRNRYFVPGKVGYNPHTERTVVYNYELREGADLAIKRLLEDMCLAMKTEGRIVLPERVYNDVFITLQPKVRRAYNEMARELAVDLRDIFDGDIHTAANAAVLTSRLSQMASGFLYVDDADVNDYAFTHLHTDKVKAVREAVDSPHEGGVLVAYRFRPEREMLLKEFGDDAHTIDEPGVVKAWNRGEIPILIAHPASVGHGLNLQDGGHTIVWASPTWDLELWDQFNKRLLRQGQKNQVNIHIVLARETIDLLVRRRLEEKSDVQQDLLAFLESPV